MRNKKHTLTPHISTLCRHGLFANEYVKTLYQHRQNDRVEQEFKTRRYNTWWVVDARIELPSGVMAYPEKLMRRYKRGVLPAEDAKFLAHYVELFDLANKNLFYEKDTDQWIP